VLKPSGVGVGKIVRQDYGAWNLTLLLRGSYDIPKTLGEQNTIIALWVQAQQISRIEVGSQPLGSYAMLMDLLEFRAWLGTTLAQRIGSRRPDLIRHADTLLKVPAQ
jgi:hypothetical protein